MLVKASTSYEDRFTLRAGEDLTDLRRAAAARGLSVEEFIRTSLRIEIDAALEGFDPDERVAGEPVN